MLPNLSALRLGEETRSEAASSDTAIDFTWFMPHFRLLSGTRELPVKGRPVGKRVAFYRTVVCPYCGDGVDVRARQFESLLAGRVHAHLKECSEFHWDLPPLRRARRVATEPEREPKVASQQLYIGSDGKLKTHELGSLLRCVADRHSKERRSRCEPCSLGMDDARSKAAACIVFEPSRVCWGRAGPHSR